MTTKTFRVESENWAYFVNLETDNYEKIGDMAIEAMTRALEAYMSGKYKEFVTDGDGEDLILSPQLSAFCEKDESNDEESFICLTSFLFQNAGMFVTAKMFKKYLDREE
tara:strand:+ start:547 stop:873 length:327 start_codon:yes stop_codon:yes gene_type:complete